MPRRVDHVLHDILEAIERIEAITKGKTLQEFSANWQLRWLVQRGIEVISEASRAIPDSLQDTEPDIPWPSVRGIGNVMRHEYDGLSDPILWRVVTDELPRLKQAILNIRGRTAS
jgi:uncharacterized protein with HEPN domain